jgi:hypothetical protein
MGARGCHEIGTPISFSIQLCMYGVLKHRGWCLFKGGGGV